MIGLMFLGVALLWLGLTVYLTVKVPGWLGLRHYASWLLRLLLVPLLLVGPFVDEIVGMGQFERLCQEQTVMTVSPAASSVQRARDVISEEKILPSYWVNIWAGTRTFFDVDTGKEFLSYPVYRTQGGRIAGLALMGGWHHCSAETAESKVHEKFLTFNTDELLNKGRSQ